MVAMFRGMRGTAKYKTRHNKDAKILCKNTEQ
jgi:hypothetical protein